MLIRRCTATIIATPASNRIRLSSRKVKWPQLNAVVGSRTGNGFELEPSGKMSRTPSRSTVPSIKVISSVLSAGAERSGSTSARAITAPSAAIAPMATTEIAMSWRTGEPTCAARKAR